MPDPLKKAGGPDESGTLPEGKTSADSSQKIRTIFGRDVGPTAEDLENEARLLWEEDPELAALLGITLNGTAGAQKKPSKKTGTEVTPGEVPSADSVKKKKRKRTTT